MINIEIPETRYTSDLEKFVEDLKQLASICHVTGISDIEVYFKDGFSGGHKALWMATGLFGRTMKGIDKELIYFHPFCNDGSISRLVKEYETHGKLVVGFDFDNTIFDVHNNGGNHSGIIKLLQECKKLGFILCLYTAELREDWLKWKVDYCKHFEIEPDYINESPLLSGTKKPFFNILLDDRAGLESAYLVLKRVVDYANTESRKCR